MPPEDPNPARGPPRKCFHMEHWNPDWIPKNPKDPEDFPIFLKEFEDMLCPSVHDNVFGILNPNSRHPSDLILTKGMNRAWATRTLLKSDIALDHIDSFLDFFLLRQYVSMRLSYLTQTERVQFSSPGPPPSNPYFMSNCEQIPLPQLYSEPAFELPLVSSPATFPLATEASPSLTARLSRQRRRRPKKRQFLSVELFQLTNNLHQ